MQYLLSRVPNNCSLLGAEEKPSLVRGRGWDRTPSVLEKAFLRHSVGGSSTDQNGK